MTVGEVCSRRRALVGSHSRGVGTVSVDGLLPTVAGELDAPARRMSAQARREGGAAQASAGTLPGA